jgi:uncharacterized protein YegP (UPF0339 family)
MVAKFVIKQADNGQFYWNLLANNNEVIAVSEMYATKQACKNGIEAAKSVVATAPIDDQTAKSDTNASTKETKSFIRRR